MHSCEAKVEPTCFFSPPPYEQLHISSTGPILTGDGGGEALDCDAGGTETSVSHELCGAALAFTGCVIFLQAFHNVNSELFFAKSRGWGGGKLSHAQTLISPSQSSQLFSTTVAQKFAMKGQQKDLRQDRIKKQCWKTYSLVKQLPCLSCLCFVCHL